MTEKPKLLVLSPVFPYPLIAGGRIRIFHLLKRLSRDFEITLLTLTDSDENETDALSFLHKLIVVPSSQTRLAQLMRILSYLPRALSGYPLEVIVKRSDRMLRELRRLLETEQFEAAVVEFTQCIQYMGPILEAGIPAALVEHDIAYVSMRRRAAVHTGFWGLIWRWEAAKIEQYEKNGWRIFNRIIAMSEVDRAEILKEAPDAQVDIIPNGVDTKRLPVTVEGDRPTLVFVGWMRHLPNRDGLTWFLTEIWPLIRDKNDAVHLHIIGRGLPNEIRRMADLDDRVNYLAYLPDIENHVGKAWVTIVPIRIGSGSRLKILESMALGTPIVTTTIGCEGIAAKDGEDVLIADIPKEFAEKVLLLLDAGDRRKQLAAKARELVENRYSWDRIAESATASIRSLMSEAAVPSK